VDGGYGRVSLLHTHLNRSEQGAASATEAPAPLSRDAPLTRLRLHTPRANAVLEHPDAAAIDAAARDLAHLVEDFPALARTSAATRGAQRWLARASAEVTLRRTWRCFAITRRWSILASRGDQAWRAGFDALVARSISCPRPNCLMRSSSPVAETTSVYVAGARRLPSHAPRREAREEPGCCRSSCGASRRSPGRRVAQGPCQ
jgi:hypothetical protein